MLLKRLKDETNSNHQRIEASLNLLGNSFTLVEYQTLLRRFWGYYHPWEQTVGTLAPGLLAGRAKSANLVADLRFLSGSSGETRAIAQCDSLPRLNTMSRILGSMYVLEGATLGGRILQAHFTVRFGFAGQGCRFFSGYGEGTGAMWKQFGEAVNAIPECESNQAVTSAIATFESMQAWLCVPEQEPQPEFEAPCSPERKIA